MDSVTVGRESYRDDREEPLMSHVMAIAGVALSLISPPTADPAVVPSERITIDVVTPKIFPRRLFINNV